MTLSKLDRLALALALAGCYYTAVPAICLTTIYLSIFFVNKSFEWRELNQKDDATKRLESALTDLEKLKTEMAAVQLKLGFSRG